MQYSLRAFFPTLISMRGLLLSSVSIVFRAMTIIFWRVNRSLVYDSQELDDLRRAESIENYSPYLQVMKQNQQEHRSWSDNELKKQKAE